MSCTASTERGSQFTGWIVPVAQALVRGLSDFKRSEGYNIVVLSTDCCHSRESIMLDGLKASSLSEPTTEESERMESKMLV